MVQITKKWYMVRFSSEMKQIPCESTNFRILYKLIFSIVKHCFFLLDVNFFAKFGKSRLIEIKAF